jgi:hypothetical protein
MKDLGDLQKFADLWDAMKWIGAFASMIAAFIGLVLWLT